MFSHAGKNDTEVSKLLSFGQLLKKPRIIFFFSVVPKYCGSCKYNLKAVLTVIWIKGSNLYYWEIKVVGEKKKP